MAKKLTTGPFQVPIFLDTGASPQNNDTLNIILKNHSDEDGKVKVKVERCNTVLFPATSTQVDLLPETEVELEEGQCTVLSISIMPGDILRIEVKGETDEELEKMEVSVIGGIGLGLNGLIFISDPALFFRHEDFKEVEDRPRRPRSRTRP